jgi:hypothetical protein
MRTALMLMCVCYVLWRPVSNGAILYPLLALLAVLAVSKFVTGERSVFKPFAVAGYLLIIAGLITALIGSIKNNPGLAQQLTVWFGGIVIWGLWALSLTRDKVRLTLQVITIATACLSGVIVLYVAAQQGLLPSFLPDSWLRSQDAGFDLTADGSAIRLLGLSTLAAAGPLVASALVAGKDTFLPSRKLLVVATVLAVVAAVLAGRRAIAAVTVLSPLLTYLFMRFLRPRTKVRRSTRRYHASVLASPLLFLLSLVALRFSLLDRPLAALGDGLHLFFGSASASGSSKSASDAVREQQAHELTAAWGDHPLFGHGLGAVLPDKFYRSAERPWMFELQYHNLLFTSGLVGVGLVLAAVISAWMGIRRAAAVNPEHVPTIVVTMVAALSMLIANASNPYLQAVGHGWSIVLVVGVANALLRPQLGPVPAAPEGSHEEHEEHEGQAEDAVQPVMTLIR